jgi:hypothetical protein
MAFYSLMGFAAYLGGGWQFAVSSGAYVGLVDATLGWLASWILGPGRPPGGSISAKDWLRVLILNVGIGCVVFGIAAGVASYFRFPLEHGK